MSKKVKQTITVGGVKFTADQVQSAIIKIGDREIVINKPKSKETKIGF